MDREPRKMGAVLALLVALPFALVMAWSQPTQGPSRAELAQALSIDAGRAVKASDLLSIRCTVQSVSYDCRWKQQEGDGWQPRRGRLAITAQGWRLAEEE